MRKARLHKILSLTGIILISVYVLASLFTFTKKNTEITCSDAEIILLDKSKVELINVIDIENFLIRKNLYPLGKKLNEVQTESIEKALGQNEMIKSAECYTTPSGKVYIKINQRIPKFRVIGGSNYYVDTERKKIKASTNYTAYLPVVSGYVNEEMIAGDLFDFISFLEKNSFWNDQIEQIYIRPDKKIELVPRVGDSIILLGTFNNYEAKLNKLKKLYTKAFNVIGWNHYKMIDLQYNGQVVCTKK